MNLPQSAQTFLCFFEATQMAAETELETKRRHPAVVAQRFFSPSQSRLVTGRRQMSDGQRLTEGKSAGVAGAAAHRLVGREDRLVGSVKKCQNQRAMAKREGKIGVE